MIAARLCAGAVLSAAVSALGCNVLGGGDDAVTQPSADTSGVLPGCETVASDGTVQGAPADLRCTGLYTDVASKTVSPRAREFAPAVPLWSDGAEKHRWIDLPDGTKIDTTSMDEWKYPVGTKVWKEFKVGGKRIETRFLTKVRDDRWLAAAYVWSADESAATLETSGASVELGGGKNYVVPKSTECDDCHKGKKDKLLGFEAISLGQKGASGFDLTALAAEGRLSAPPAKTEVTIADDGTKHSAAALAWLHVNCGTSCHTGTSTATAYGTGLRLRIGWDEISGKPPAAWEIVKSTVGVTVKSPKWAGDTRITPGDPKSSRLFELLSERGDEQMPPIATRVVDDRGVAAVRAWITAMRPAPSADVEVERQR